jgi:hypothetical protein
MSMHGSVWTQVAVALAAPLAVAVSPAAAAISAGTLQCQIGAGVGLILVEQQRLTCTFHPAGGGPAEHYHGHVRKFGLTVGVTGGSLVIWAVLSAQSYTPGTLAGTYVGISAEATAIYGVGANALLGGSHKQMALQPLSIQGQVGVDIAAAVTEMELKAR